MPDPFEVIGEKPGNVDYQWVTTGLHDASDAFSQVIRMIGRGWSPVPPSRHPMMPHNGDQIAYGGQVLMERPIARRSPQQNLVAEWLDDIAKAGFVGVVKTVTNEGMSIDIVGDAALAKKVSEHKIEEHSDGPRPAETEDRQ